MIPADEKSQPQALGRRHDTELPGPGRAMRYEFEYRRGGTLVYLAAWDAHHARLFDRAHHRDRAVRAAGRTRYGNGALCRARRVFWIVDTGSSHAGKASIKRREGRWKNPRLIHLPVHAS